MSFDFSKILDSIRITPVVAGSVLLFTSAVLFTPSQVLDSLSITTLRDQYAPWVGAAFLFSIAVLIAHCFKPTAMWLTNRFRYFSALHKGKNYLRTLTSSEKELLRQYLKKGFFAEMTG